MSEQELYKRLDEAIAMVERLAKMLKLSAAYEVDVTPECFPLLNRAKDMVERHQSRVYPVTEAKE